MCFDRFSNPNQPLPHRGRSDCGTCCGFQVISLPPPPFVNFYSKPGAPKGARLAASSRAYRLGRALDNPPS